MADSLRPEHCLYENMIGAWTGSYFHALVTGWYAVEYVD